MFCAKAVPYLPQRKTGYGEIDARKGRPKEPAYLRNARGGLPRAM